MNLWRYQLERTGKTKRSISSRLGRYRVDRRRSGKATATQPLAPNLFHLQFSLLSAWPVSEARVKEKSTQGSLRPSNRADRCMQEPAHLQHLFPSFLSSPLIGMCRRRSSGRVKQGPLELSIALRCATLPVKASMLLRPREGLYFRGPASAVGPPKKAV